MLDILVPAIAGLIAGAIASLAAPWANWGVEKKRLIREARAKLISEARLTLVSDSSETQFMNHPIYSQLRPHLSAHLVERIEDIGRHKLTIVTGHGRHSGVNPYVQQTLDELVKLERTWDLI